jgi:hypothetical protein
MKCSTTSAIRLIAAAGIIWLGAVFPSSSSAHCDTMDGPVVTEAKAALEKGDVTPVLTLHDTIAAGETHHGHSK